jgi:hypothetical protein
MAGSLTISTLNNDTGPLATQNGMTGVAKAWVQFAGSTAAINGSFNVSSITKVKTGTYTINMTTAMSNINYSVCASASPTGTVPCLPPQLFTVEGVNNWNITPPTTTAFSLVTPSYTTAVSDMVYVCAAVFGT